ncbi:hypothetical protein D3C72_1578210 [compost metagenome]
MPGRLEPGQEFRQHPRLERIGLACVAAANQLVLFSDVGQVEELVEGPRHRQQLVFSQVVEGRAQLFGSAAAVSLGAAPDVFDCLQKRFAVLLTNGVPQQLAQQMNIFTQAHIDISHQPCLRHSWKTALAPECPTTGHAFKADQRRRRSYAEIRALRIDEVIMKIRELARHWEQNAKGRLSPTGHVLHLDVESAARLAALAEMYPKRRPEELLGELLGAALEELEASFPYIQGQHVIATDEEGDPLYEDIGPTPRFLALSRRYLQDMSTRKDESTH